MQLGDICEAIVDCEHKTAPLADTGYPSIRTPNIGRGYFILDNVNRVSEETYKLWSRRTVPRAGDLIMAREAPVGNVAMIPNGLKPCLGQRTVLIRCDTSKVSPRYIVYLLIGPEVQGTIHSMTNGVTVPHLNMEDIRTLPLPELPPLPTQRKIAAILSAYDDLIENNTRRIKILEEMAQAIYREWFVHFRFPGHEQVKLVDSGTELGMVPERWKIGTIADLCDFIARGVTPKYRAGSERFIINQKSNRGTFIDFAQLKELDPELYVPKGKFARVEDVLINSLGEGTLGRVHYFLGPDEEWAVDQHMTICRASIPGSTIYIYYYLSSDEGQARIEGLKTGGTNMTMLNISEVRQFLLFIPPKKYLEMFYHSIKSFWHLKHILELKNTNLKRTRDMILPRLINGELDVSELEIPTP